MKLVKIDDWKNRGKYEGKLIPLHARFSYRNCGDEVLNPRICPNLVVILRTWTYPKIWIKCINPKPRCLRHAKIWRPFDRVKTRLDKE